MQLMQVLHINYIKHLLGTQHTQTIHTPHSTTHTAYGYQELQTPTQSNSPEQQTYHTNTNLNQLVIDLLRHQTDLAHNTQCLHQKTTDAFHNSVNPRHYRKMYISVMI